VNRQLPVQPHEVWSEVPSDRIGEAAERAAAADALLAVGGGSAIDLAKAISVETGLPVVSVPTTYSGAEWSRAFGIRDPQRRMRGGGAGANLGAIVYEPELTLSLPRPETVGTSLNALAHCAEALYVRDRDPSADAIALEGAETINRALPRVVDAPDDLEPRTELLRGAARGGEALGRSGLALGHAIAQALGGRYGIAHGALNAVCLAPALRFNREVAPDAYARLSAALGGDAVERVRELARLGGFERLRDLGVPEDELRDVASAVTQRAGAKANPRAATAAEVEQLLRSVW
jgi:alcohol dehydrogenase class IV